MASCVHGGFTEFMLANSDHKSLVDARKTVPKDVPSGFPVED